MQRARALDAFQVAPEAADTLADLIARDRLKLVITDIVIREVEARIHKAVSDAAAVHKRFSKDARVLGSSTLDGVADKIERFDEAAVAMNLKENFHKFLADNKAITIGTRDVSLD